MIARNQVFPVPPRLAPGMRRRLGAACCLALLVCGCGGTAAESVKPSSRPDLSTDPLTIDTWKQSQDIEKYGPEALKRLRADNPELKSRENWNTFYEEVVAPGFRRDVLGHVTAQKE